MKKENLKIRDAVSDAYIICAACKAYLVGLDERLKEIQNSDDFPPDCEENQLDYNIEVCHVHDYYQSIIDLHEHKMWTSGSFEQKLMMGKFGELSLLTQARKEKSSELSNNQKLTS